MSMVTMTVQGSSTGMSKGVIHAPGAAPGGMNVGNATVAKGGKVHQDQDGLCNVQHSIIVFVIYVR
jgi:hypothetical protein